MRRAALALLLAGSAQAQTVILYSRADADKAEQVKQLASVYSPVFIDRVLPGGVPWRQAISQAICNADVVLVIWSKHAASSQEVGHEWRLAVTCSQRVIPVLLDATPMPGELGTRQAIDMR